MKPTYKVHLPYNRDTSQILTFSELCEITHAPFEWLHERGLIGHFVNIYMNDHHMTYVFDNAQTAMLFKLSH